jgi:non-lysosomal glucosylceramidase
VRFHDGGVGPAGLRGTFAIAVREDPGVTLTARSRFDTVDDRTLWDDFATDGRLDELDDRRPAAAGEAAGGAVAATVELAPFEHRSVRFAIAWDLPVVEFGSGRRWWRRYTRTWGRDGACSFELARHALERTADWRAAIERWQRPILEDPARPDWYKGALFNELYYLLDGGTFWEAGEVGGTDPARDDVGRFGLLECVDYPFYDTVDVDFYASFAMLRLFPELEAAGIRDLLRAVDIADPTPVVIDASGSAAPRKLAGAVPHDLGGPDEDPFRQPNRYRFQDVNGWKDLAPKLVLQAYRDAVALDDQALLAQARPVAERVLERLLASDRDGDGLPEHDGIPDQTYDTWPMCGPSAYGGSLWLAAVRAAERLAGLDGDERAQQRWASVGQRAARSFEARLWREPGYYAYDDGGGPSADSVMADQLAGQWYADVIGLGDLVDPRRVETALRTILRLNVRGFAGGSMGAVNGMRPDGTVDRSSEQSAEAWVGTTYALAAFMIGRGLVAEGWETARGAAAVTYDRGLWFRTPEAYDERGDYRASLYLRPLAIWAIEDALARRR